MKSDVIGIFARSSGVVVLDCFYKLQTGEFIESRFGPSRYEDVVDMTEGTLRLDPSCSPMVRKHLQRLGAREKESKGKPREVYTQVIDGICGNFKTWFKARRRAHPDKVWTVLKNGSGGTIIEKKTCFCCF